VRFKKILTTAAACVCIAGLAAAHANDADDDLEDSPDAQWVNNVPPMSYTGLRGLTQTTAAEPLGEGRFNASIFFSTFKQDQSSPLIIKPKPGNRVSVLSGVLSWGVNSNVDLFGVLPLFIISGEKPTKAGLGELMGGVQFTFPIPEEIPFRLAASLTEIQGIRTGDWDKRDITSNVQYWRSGGNSHENPDDSYWKDDDSQENPEQNLSYAGYDYFDARANNSLDLIIKLSQSLVAGNARFGGKIHLNEGFVITPGYTDDIMFLFAGGLEFNPTEFLTFGAEINWRTPSGSLSFSDPLWVTPSVMYRSPYLANGLLGISVVAGIDIRMSSQGEDFTYKTDLSSGGSKDNVVDGTYSLEPYRIFADVAFSFDMLASKRREMQREARRNAAEKARLRRQAELTAAQKDSIARKAYEDSLALAATLAAKAEKARQDSIAQAEGAAEREAQLKAQAEGREAQLMAQAAGREAQLKAEAEQKRIADSIALAEANRRLAEEKAKRSEAEQQMLSTGMLVLDGVFFVTGKAEIQLNSRGYLTTLAKMLVKYPKLRIEIGGHTDNVGNLQTNLNLSQKRAEAVFIFMHNINPALAQMLSTRGYGPTEPKADNSTAAGREVNRRVELRVLNPEVLKEYNP
jgi:outer membrane protein OmpA-like peptidoglycan-associated protein